jgi:hypothetical protein
MIGTLFSPAVPQEILMRYIPVLLVLALAVAAPASADEPITKPVRYTWIATSCDTWNCAAAAMVMANGDKYVMVLPTGRDEKPWIILRRVEEGSIFIPDEEPYTCSVYPTVNEASIEYEVMDTCHAPLILNVPDGRAVVASLRSCGSSKKRAVR